jgi:Plasmid pRiA4b ORF-3-like protein
MAKTWIQIRVDLLGGRDIECKPQPGRIIAVGPRHSFAALSEAIDGAFARYDLGHLHGFELKGDRHIGIPDDDWPEPEWENEARLSVAKEVSAGDVFAYTFDFGDSWEHRCTVLPDKLDPTVDLGGAPSAPLVIDGWGWIPDQYGRESYDEE